MRVQRWKKRRRDGEELTRVSVVHQSEPIPTSDLLLRKDPIAPVRLYTGKADLIIGAGKGNECWPRLEWLRGMTAAVDDV